MQLSLRRLWSNSVKFIVDDDEQRTSAGGAASRISPISPFIFSTGTVRIQYATTCTVLHMYCNTQLYRHGTRTLRSDYYAIT